jgi:hypothetical protein
MAYKANGKTRLEWAASMIGKMTIHGVKVTTYKVGLRNTGCWFYTFRQIATYLDKQPSRGYGMTWHPWPKDCKEDLP